jgi:restriction system protein
MALFNGEQQRALRVLTELYQRPASPERYAEWLHACEMLSKVYTRESAETCSKDAKGRMRYLLVVEPAPRREDFLPPPPLPRDSVRLLAEVERQFENAGKAHAAREHSRAQELKRANQVYAQVCAVEAARRLKELDAEAEAESARRAEVTAAKAARRKEQAAAWRAEVTAAKAARRKEQAAAKAARRAEAEVAAAKAARREKLDAAKAAREATQHAEWLRTRWPADAVVDADVLAIDTIDGQIDVQNDKIAEQVNKLSNLLPYGLLKTPRKSKGGAAPDAERIVERVEGALSAMRLPPGVDTAARLAYSPDSRQVVVEFELPKETVIPKAKYYRWVGSRGVVQATPRPQTQVRSLYASAIAQLTLLSLNAIFAAEPALDVVVFNGVVDTLDRRTGQPIRPCLITVRVTRDTFTGLNLNSVDPQACLKHLSASLSKSPMELIPVRPVLEFSMVDPRFVAETDALSSMDGRTNLLELTWQEFESLIQNLFTRMGLEARQTRPSRDGGVDCVAYDTRPIFGGKVVIQAKRYKNTVGVSAVRDLYGTLQNEGASKGILVTTSGYGAASFEFAQNKPIELIDGSSLLYLLEEHAGIKARIEPPEDWRDPVPDSGDLAGE